MAVLRTSRRRTPRRQGFTLIELIVVFGIISLLAGVVLVILGDTRNRARIRRAEADVRNLDVAINLLINDTFLLPNRYSASSCLYQVAGNEVALNTEDGGLVGTGTGFAAWQGPYLIDGPIDPWGNPYWFDHDYDCSAAAPDGCTGQPQWVQAAVSSGPNQSAIDVYDSDNIVRVRCR